MEDKGNDKMKEKLIKNKLKKGKSFSILNIFCCCKFVGNAFSKFGECVSKLSILCQFIIYLIPVLIILLGIMIFIHLYFFYEIFKFDFYAIIKEEFLRYFISDLDDINFDLNKKKTSLMFEDTANLIFFKIYFEELNSYGLLSDDDEKIFPDISDQSESVYELLEQPNSIYSIPSNMSKQYIDSREDKLSELGKLYYYFFPLIVSETYSANSPINQSFFISYEVDEDNDIKGNELYFNFPRISDDFIQNNNFFPYNNLIAPRVLNNSKCQELYKNEENNLFIHDNWFIFHDCQFRNQSLREIDIKSLHLNENNRGSINKTNIMSLQTYLKNSENKKIILNLIFFMGQIKIANQNIQDSVFLIYNQSINNKKFSDNLTYVLNFNDIVEVALSTELDEYFHYGLSSVDYNFYSEGVFYDNIDINELYEPSNKYSTIEGFEFDMRYFSSFYLYIKLFQKSNYTTEYMETDHINYYIFNDSEQIKEICSKFNFKLYIDSLEDSDIDCFSEKNLLYYSKENINTFFSEGYTLPYCICLPLYCIKNLDNNIDMENLELADEIILPEQCQNNLLYYNNEIEDYSGNAKITDIRDINLRIGENLNDQLESQYFKFTFEQKQLNGGLSFVMVSIINNDSMKKILTEFMEKLNSLTDKFTIISSVEIVVVFFLISTLIILYIYSLSKVIHEYEKKAYFYLKKLTDNKDKTELQKKSEENSSLFDKNNYEELPLLNNENNYEKNVEENELIDDLYKIYSKFYRLSENKFMEEVERQQKNKNLVKIDILNKSNELFHLFVKLAMYIPHFKLDINIDYDFYKDSKLIQNFLKCVSKKNNTNEDKEQILYTKSILKELLSTELINDYGFITNLNFNYMTNINLNVKKEEKNYIQDAIFKKVEEMAKNNSDDNIYDKNIKDDFNIENIKIVFKNKNLVMKKIEEKFEQDDYLNLSKLESYFNETLINSFYNYTKKIITEESNS